MTPNPQTKRATRVKWSMKPSKDGEQLLAYGSGKNLIVRDLKDPCKSIIFNRQLLNPITCVKYNHNGYFIAIGDEKGGVKVLGWNTQ